MAIGLIVGIVVGMLVLGGFIWFRAASIMIVENPSLYDFDRSVETILAKAETLKWKVPAIHAIHETLEKAGFTVKRATVIEICRPDYAFPLMEKDNTRNILSMMPCRIGVYETQNGDVLISRMNTGLMAKLFGGLVTKVMSKASQDSEQIIKSVTG